MDFVLDITWVRSMQKRYFIGSRLPEPPELKLLADAVESSHLIMEKKSTALIEKLGHLTSRHNATPLDRPFYMDGTARTMRLCTAPSTPSTNSGHPLPIFQVHAETGKALKHRSYRCPHLESGFPLRGGLC